MAFCSFRRSSALAATSLLIGCAYSLGTEPFNLRRDMLCLEVNVWKKKPLFTGYLCLLDTFNRAFHSFLRSKMDTETLKGNK